MLDAEVRGERFQVEANASQCSHCGRLLLHGRSRRAYHRAASDAYRRQHGMLTAAELIQLRTSLGMTWKKFAAHTGVGVATLKRWLAGEIQSPSLDSLVRLKADLTFAERALEELVRLTVDEQTTARETETASRWTIVPEDWFERLGLFADTKLELAA